ncbi:MAG: dihydroorotase [Acidobacteriota bacterium]
MRLLLKGARLVDPASGVDGQRDILIDGGRVVRVGVDIPAGDCGNASVVDLGRDLVVSPGLIDMHVHLREPGFEHKETIATGTGAAVAGGFTAVACMPNTNPVNDNAAVTRFILKQAGEARFSRVYPIGAVTHASAGEQLAEIAELRAAGCVALSDDGRPVATALLMRRALEYGGMFGMTIIDHCEDRSLAGQGVAHEGYHAGQLGLRGIPAAAEDVMVDRDIVLAEATGSSLHIAHLSTAGALRSVRGAKARGVRVTCEVTPHHFTLTDERLGAPLPYDTRLKVNPPLRTAADREALVSGLADGSIDAIATDHAPHHHDEKNVEFDLAPFGIVGLETAVSLSFDRLVHRGTITLRRLVELLSVNPARILGVPGGRLAEGDVADLTVLAPDLQLTVSAAVMRSLSRNTPFDGWTLRGGIAATIVGGRVRYVNPDVPAARGLEKE